MFFDVRSKDTFNFPLGLIKHIVIVVMVSVDVKHHVYLAGNLTGETFRTWS